VYHEIHGPRNAAATVVLSSGLGGAAHYWTPQIPELTRHFRVIVYDQFGTGRSPGSLPAGYSVADMAAELACLLRELAVSKCHFVGHALGGLVGLQLALDRPDLIDRMVLVNAWTKTHPHTVRCFAARRSLLLDSGVAAYVAAQPLFLYPADWLADRQMWLADQDAAGLAHFPPAETVLRRIDAILVFDLEARISAIAARTLVLAARDDVLVPSICSTHLATLLPRGRLCLLDHGGHACNITDPDAFNSTIGAFLLDAEGRSATGGTAKSQALEPRRVL
jgi:aminoacrylate hydrolase